MIRYGDKEFTTRKELFKYLADNKDDLIAEKKMVLKQADCMVTAAPTIVIDPKVFGANKADDVAVTDILNKDSLKVICVINTTNWLDNHGDVHISGLWNRTLANNKMMMHLREHSMKFDYIIADGEQLKAYVKPFTWTELGYPYEGDTEALIFESEILKKRNPFMFEQYANKWVRNHSVGMRYVKMDMAINDEDMPNYYEAWKKYYPLIANKEDADERGYFWYVLEAKLIEGSSVPLGSNSATPTIGTGKGSPANNDDPPQGTHNDISDPEDKSTQIDYKFLLSNLKTS